ncbi:UNVERIFIED_CONTAM: hypothetical protein GTU68_066668 [Idotea baltica]|nr:hypothetical protein [Idotea baltica]
MSGKSLKCASSRTAARFAISHLRRLKTGKTRRRASAAKRQNGTALLCLVKA